MPGNILFQSLLSPSLPQTQPSCNALQINSHLYLQVSVTYTMKPITCSTSSEDHLNVFTFMDDTEFEVAEILLQLPQLVFKSESLHRLSFTSWGGKQRRSSKTEPPSLPPVGSNSISKIEKPKALALSPATPLSFPPSESEDKSKHSKRKVSLKRKKEELLEKINELTDRKEFFKEEIKNVQLHYNEQKLLNLRLKAKKQMLILGLPKEDSASKSNLNHAAMLNIPDEKQDDAAYTKPCEESVVGTGACLLDLNLLPEERGGGGGIETVNVKGVDKSEKKALATQARYRRIQIRRSKNPNVRLHYPSCR